MTKQIIEIEIPDGYKFVRYDYVKQHELFIHPSEAIETWEWGCKSNNKYFIVEEIKPKQIILEYTGEKRPVFYGEIYKGADGLIYTWNYHERSVRLYEVLKVVDE